MSLKFLGKPQHTHTRTACAPAGKEDSQLIGLLLKGGTAQDRGSSGFGFHSKLLRRIKQVGLVKYSNIKVLSITLYDEIVLSRIL